MLFGPDNILSLQSNHENTTADNTSSFAKLDFLEIHIRVLFHDQVLPLSLASSKRNMKWSRRWFARVQLSLVMLLLSKRAA